MLAHPVNVRHDPTHLDVRDHGLAGKRLDDLQGPGRHHITRRPQRVGRGCSEAPIG